MASEILNSLKTSIFDPLFLKDVFQKVILKRKQMQEKDGDNFKRILSEEYFDISSRLDENGLQESVSYRNVTKAKKIATLLINDKGEFNENYLPYIIKNLQQFQFFLGPNYFHDALRDAHLLKVLTLLQEKKELVKLLKTISKPHQHPLADTIIRATLQLKENASITDAHAKRAALSAWLTTLRQNIGSCFATAPAIIVHDEQPELFLKDIKELLATGRLKRVFGGVEHSVPICDSWGASDLRKPFLLSNDDVKEAPWHAAGIILALEASEYFPKELSQDEKIAHLHKEIIHTFSELGLKPYFITYAEEIFKKVLLKKYNLTELELKGFLNRPRDMVFSTLVFQPAHASTKMGGKSDLFGHFLNDFDTAKNAFKALTDNALLKVWEFTLASFSETKLDFTRWNLYASLGFNPNDKGGIGDILYQIIKDKLNYYNTKVSDVQVEYEYLFAQVKQLESRIRNASDEKEAQWIRVEYQSKANEFYTLEEIRNKAHQKASIFARLFDILMDQYDQLFPQYFQEVYDPDLHEIKATFFDDSPAGFRLLYKYGRDNTSQWSRIKTPHEFIDCLVKFFVASETPLKALDVLQSIQEDISDIVTQLVHHVRSEIFLETAFDRMAIAHHVKPISNPLEHLEEIPMKPWCYISGGTMNTLISNYYRSEEMPFEVSRWVENPMELLVFIMETLKQVPFKQMEEFEKNPHKSMLMHSPTHAFLLKPGFSLVKKGWSNENFTYTWVRDQLVLPLERFHENIILDEEMQSYLIHEFSKIVHKSYAPYFRKVFSTILKTTGSLSVADFRELLIDKIDHERGLHYANKPILSSDEIDRVLYECVPFTPKSFLYQNVQSIIKNLKLSSDKKDKMVENLYELLEGRNDSEFNVVSSQQLQDIVIALYCLSMEVTSSKDNIQGDIKEAAQMEGLSFPPPIIFADSNWVKDFFGFVVNPGTGKLQLWRLDCLGRSGAPMSSWQEWLNGSRKDRQWGLYPKIYQYQTSELLNSNIYKIR